MADELEPADIVEEGEDLFETHQNDLMKLFEHQTFRAKWQRVFTGLRMPPDSGPHKWAKLQMVRLLSPLMAVVVPTLVLGIITLFAEMGPEQVPIIQVKVIEAEPFEDLEDIEDPIMETIDPPDPVDVDFTTEATLAPTEVSAPPVETAVLPAEFDTVAMVRSPVIMKGMFGSRNPGSRRVALDRFGGGGETEDAVLRALRYLKTKQQKNGSWAGTPPALTSLALLAYLAHGDTPASEEFGSTVKSAIRFLLASQEPSGHFKGRDAHDYTQPIAAYAMSEAYAMTKVPQLKQAAIKAMKPIVKGQNPSGGFNYNLKPTTRNDTSYMAWCVQALKAAKMGGLYEEIDGLDECMKKSIAGFKKNYGEKDGIGGFGYSSPSATHGLSAAGVLCLQFLGASKSRECRGGLAGLARWKFDWADPHPGSFLYYMYYATQAKFQEGGKTWEKWNAQFAPSLVKNQEVKDKSVSGYKDHRGQPQAIGLWHSPAKKEHGAGEMDTILCTLMLEVYYRYLPTFMPVPVDDDEDEEIGDDDDDLEIDFVDSETVPRQKFMKVAQAEDAYLEIDLS